METSRQLPWHIERLRSSRSSRDMDELDGFDVVYDHIDPHKRYYWNRSYRFEDVDSSSHDWMELAVATRCDEAERVDEAWFKTYPVTKLAECITGQFPELECEIIPTGGDSEDSILSVYFPADLSVDEIQRILDSIHRDVSLCGYFKAHIARMPYGSRGGYRVVVTYEYRHSAVNYHPHGLLYHVTPEHNIAKIMSGGLCPRGRAIDGNSNGRSGDALSNRANFAYPNRIYLLKHLDLEVVRMYLRNGNKKNRTGRDTFDRHFVVLAVQPSDDMLVTDDPMFCRDAVYTTQNIKPTQVLFVRHLEYDEDWNLIRCPKDDDLFSLTD